jgi:hypothetical protein
LHRFLLTSLESVSTTAQRTVLMSMTQDQDTTASPSASSSAASDALPVTTLRTLRPVPTGSDTDDANVCVHITPRFNGVSSEKDSFDVSVVYECKYPPHLASLSTHKSLAFRTKRKRMTEVEGLARAADHVFCQELAAAFTRATQCVTYAVADASGLPLPAAPSAATEMFWTTKQISDFFDAASARTGRRVMQEYMPEIDDVAVSLSISGVAMPSNPSAYDSTGMDKALAHRTRPDHLDVDVLEENARVGGLGIACGATMVWGGLSRKKLKSRSAGEHAACFESVDTLNASGDPQDRVFQRSYRFRVGTTPVGDEGSDQPVSRVTDMDGKTHIIRHYQLGVYPHVDADAVSAPVGVPACGEGDISYWPSYCFE